MKEEAYIRQFLASPKPLEAPEGWAHRNVLPAQWNLYSHPSLEVSEAYQPQKGLVLLGFALDPDDPEKTNDRILRELIENPSWEETRNHIERLTGRFVLLAQFGNKIRALHDPCGLRALFFTQEAGTPCLGSNPKLLAQSLRRAPTETLHRVHALQIDWTPVGTQLFEGISGLLPNHELDLETLAAERFWPKAILPIRSLEESATLAAQEFRKLIAAATQRFPLALGLTAGWDSRVLLGACRDHLDRIPAYTLQYPGIKPSFYEIAVPTRLSRDLGINHQIYRCDQTPTEAFSRAYEENTWTQRPDWAHIAYNLRENLPEGRVCIKGNGSEIARYTNYQAQFSPEVAAGQHTHIWIETPTLLKVVDDWMKNSKKACQESHVDQTNLFYWEHRMGGWQAQGQSDTDLVMEKLTPYNHRPILEALLSAPLKSRIPPWHPLYTKLIEILWPELNKYQKNRKTLRTLAAHWKKRAVTRKNILRVKNLKRTGS